MGNCLVTKLKSVVDNDSLLKIGEMKIHLVVPTEGGDQYYNQFRVYCPREDLTLKVLGGHNIWSYSAQTMQATKNLGNTITAKNITGCFPEAGEYDIVISSKYDIEAINLPATALVDVSEFRFTSNIVSITSRKQSQASYPDSRIYGSLDPVIANNLDTIYGITFRNQYVELSVEMLMQATRITSVSLGNCPNVKGNFELFGNKNITFEISSSQCTGTVEGFVRNRVNNAQVATGSIANANWIAYNSGITFKGTAVPITAGALAWEPYGTNQTKITFCGEEVIIDN